MYMSKYGMKIFGMADQAAEKNPMGKGYIIMTPKGKMYNVMTGQRMYMDMAEMMNRAQAFMPKKQKKTKMPKVKYKKLGSRKKLGKKCTMFQAKIEGKTDAMICMISMTDMGVSAADAKKIDKVFTSFNDEMTKNNPDMASNTYDYRALNKAMGASAFPLWSEFKSGGNTTTMMTTKFQARAMQASEFRVPKGYKKFQMPVFNPGTGMDPKQLEALKKQMEQMKKQKGN